MQQTERYKLNLIEKTDPFSPEALNENTQKMESIYLELLGADTAQAQAQTALEGRVTTLEAHHIVVGTYTGTGATKTVSLGFTPIAVLLHSFDINSQTSSGLLITGIKAYFKDPHSTDTGEIVQGGFAVRGNCFGINGGQYLYVAFA